MVADGIFDRRFEQRVLEAYPHPDHEDAEDDETPEKAENLTEGCVGEQPNAEPVHDVHPRSEREVRNVVPGEPVVTLSLAGEAPTEMPEAVP